MILKFSKAGMKLFGAQDINNMVDFFSKLQIPVIWGFGANENLASDEVAIMAFATGISKPKEKKEF